MTCVLPIAADSTGSGRCIGLGTRAPHCRREFIHVTIVTCTAHMQLWDETTTTVLLPTAALYHLGVSNHSPYFAQSSCIE